MTSSHPMIPIEGRCPVCVSPFGAAALYTCSVCETRLHTECAEYLGGCARFACTEAATPRKRLTQYLEAYSLESVHLYGWASQCFLLLLLCGGRGIFFWLVASVGLLSDSVRRRDQL